MAHGEVNVDLSCDICHLLPGFRMELNHRLQPLDQQTPDFAQTPNGLVQGLEGPPPLLGSKRGAALGIEGTEPCRECRSFSFSPPGIPVRVFQLLNDDHAPFADRNCARLADSGSRSLCPTESSPRPCASRYCPPEDVFRVSGIAQQVRQFRVCVVSVMAVLDLECLCVVLRHSDLGMTRQYVTDDGFARIWQDVAEARQRDVLASVVDGSHWVGSPAGEQLKARIKALSPDAVPACNVVDDHDLPPKGPLPGARVWGILDGGRRADDVRPEADAPGVERAQAELDGGPPRLVVLSPVSRLLPPHPGFCLAPNSARRCC